MTLFCHYLQSLAINGIIIDMEGNKHSIASKKRWENVSPEDRKIKMAALAMKKWESMPLEERVAHAKMMRSRVGKKVV